MKNLIFLLTNILLFSAVGFAQQVNNAQPANAGDLIWSDEFDGTGAPDPSKWDRPEYNRRDNANGPDDWWSNDDSYLDGNGHLIIRIRKIANKNNDGDSCDYSTGVVRTLGKYEPTYGRFVIRCKLPTQAGWWVAFWMMQGDQGSVGNGGVDGSEVDIMEAFGWSDKINHAIHWDGYGADHKSVGKNELIPGIHEGFHTYMLDWYPEKYIFYVDSVEQWRSEGGGVCNQPGYIKVTGELSTEDWAMNEYWANNPADATYPDSLVVDWVRVYELGDYVEPGTGSIDKKNNELKVIPNPVNNYLTLNLPETYHGELTNVSILNSLGQVTKSISSVEAGSRVSVKDLDKGIYIITVNHNGLLYNQKFMKL